MPISVIAQGTESDDVSLRVAIDSPIGIDIDIRHPQGNATWSKSSLARSLEKGAGSPYVTLDGATAIMQQSRGHAGIFVTMSTGGFAGCQIGLVQFRQTIHGVTPYSFEVTTLDAGLGPRRGKAHALAPETPQDQAAEEQHGEFRRPPGHYVESAITHEIPV